MWPDTARPELDGFGELLAQERFDGLEEPESVLDAVGITEQPKASDAVGRLGAPGSRPETIGTNRDEGDGGVGHVVESRQGPAMSQSMKSYGRPSA